MSRIPRWLRITLYVLVPLLLIAWIVPYFIDADRYRPDIVSAIEKETGRKASIGKITARLIPSVGFVIENISLGNPPGFPEGNFASVDRVKGSLAWGPLIFRKEFQLKAIEVVHPVVTLLEDENGRVNYDFAAKPGKAGSSTSSGMPGNFRIADVDSIRLTDAEIIMAQVGGRKRTAVAWLKATKLNVDLSNIALDIKKIKQWGADIDLGGAELWMSGIKGNIEFKSGEFKLRDGKAHADFKAAIGKAATGKGTLHVDDIEKAVAVFDISTPLLDVDQLMDSKAEEPPFATRITKSELVAQGKFAADKIRVAPYEVTQATAELRVYTDRAEIWPMKMGVYGGTLQVSAKVDRRPNPQRFSANIQVADVDLAKAAASSPDTRGKITGIAKMNLQTVGSLGGSLLNSLTGNGDFAVRDGGLPGLNLGKTIEMLTKVEKILSLGQSSSLPSQLTFRSIAGDLAPGNGRIASKAIHVDSNVGSVDLHGSIGFDQTLEYDGAAQLAQSSSGSNNNPNNPIGAIGNVFGGVMKNTVGRGPLPFSIRGTLQNPKISPRLGGLSLPGGGSGQTGSQQPAQQPKSIFDMFKKKKSG